ncbi:hypothetical protein VPH35_026539 [Triticum aestivum]
MDPNMKELQGTLIDIETDAEQLLLARHQLVENDRMRNANREALTALRKRAKTTKTSVASPFEIVMKEVEGTSAKQLVKEICSTCGNHDPKEQTWLMFSGSDIFARVPFHVAHTVLDKGTRYEGHVEKDGEALPMNVPGHGEPCGWQIFALCTVYRAAMRLATLNGAKGVRYLGLLV